MELTVIRLQLTAENVHRERRSSIAESDAPASGIAAGCIDLTVYIEVGDFVERQVSCRAVVSIFKMIAGIAVESEIAPDCNACSLPRENESRPVLDVHIVAHVQISLCKGRTVSKSELRLGGSSDKLSYRSVILLHLKC